MRYQARTQAKPPKRGKKREVFDRDDRLLDRGFLCRPTVRATWVELAAWPQLLRWRGFDEGFERHAER